ncbi:Testicular haploid expressed repeat [Cinara cedri]|uniref:Testicular haploid expressed repeat n=1 Tax=Cinara cedri TaxID=506608 RepID=A0A5E4NRB2_9HEMI|nr:Testicular haploid expressed repeat [Cinara cedri]
MSSPRFIELSRPKQRPMVEERTLPAPIPKAALRGTVSDRIIELAQPKIRRPDPECETQKPIINRSQPTIRRRKKTSDKPNKNVTLLETEQREAIRNLTCGKPKTEANLLELQEWLKKNATPKKLIVQPPPVKTEKLRFI